MESLSGKYDSFGFSELYLKSSNEIDILASWMKHERYIYSYIPLFVLTSLQCFFPLIKNEEYTQTRKQEKGSLI